MSTRSVIARVGEHEGQFAGRYHHSDSYPTELGKELWRLYHGHFQCDLSKMLAFLIDQHPAGWSEIVGKDFSLRPGYTWQRATEKSREFAVYSQLPDYKRPQCYCHGQRHEEGFLFTHETFANGEDGSAEWLYVFDEEQHKLFIRDLNHKEDVAVIDLNGEEPNWVAIECGEHFERCHHCAWVHKLLPRTSNLSTLTWLGKRPLDFHDAVAFVVNGKRLKNTGSGGDSDFLNCSNFRFNPDRKPFPSGTYVATVVLGNGKRIDIPVAKRIENGFAPLPGVQWVYPPTKDNPQETLVSA